MKALTLLALTATLLLSAGCAGESPLGPPDVTDNIELQGQDDGQVQKKTGCSGSGIALSSPGETTEQSSPEGDRPDKACKGGVPITP